MVFMVPFRRDITFLDRPHVLTSINEEIESHDFVALTGPGGIGKTHIAIEFCYRFYEQYPKGLVVWISAGSPARLQQSLTEISRKLSVPSQTKSPILDLLKWLDDASRPDWLLVLDGIVPKSLGIITTPQSNWASENESVITNMLKSDSPKASQGKILITRQSFGLSPEMKTRMASFVMPLWTREEAKTLLQAKLPIANWEESFASDVIDFLECHPLAITLAASYIARNGYSTEYYLNEIRALPMATLVRQKNDLLDEIQGAFHGLDISINTSFAQLSQEKPLAIDLLFLISTLDSQGIPKNLLFRDGEKVRSFNAAIRVLNSFSMVTEDSEGENLYVSGPVHSWIENKLKSENLWLFWNSEVIEVIAERFPHGSFDHWRSCSFLMPHATKLIGCDLAEMFCSQCSRVYMQRRATILEGISSYDENRGLYILAYGNIAQALAIVRGLEPSWRNKKAIIEISKRAARMLCQLGRYEEAKHLLEQTLNDGSDKSEQDEEDVILLNDYNALARIAHEQADYKTAEKYYERALEMNIKEHYEDHVDSLIIKSNLAGLRKDQGNYADAARMIREVLDARRALRGTEHPDTLQSMSDLAVVLISQGDYPEAEKMCREALDIANRVQGAEHPDTLTVYGNLAGVLSRRGKYEEAANMRRRLLALKEAALGPDHVLLITIRNSLAVDLEKMGEYAEAEKFFKPIVAQAEKAFGEDHPTTLNAMNGLGLVLLRQGKHQEAEPMLRNVLELKIKFFGEKHQQTLINKNNLAGCLQRQSLFSKAEILHKETFAIAKEVLGEKHPFTLRSKNNVAEVLRDQGRESAEKLAEAEKLQREALAGRQEVLGEDHPETLTSMHNLARILKQQGRVEEALPLHRCALNGFKEKLGEDNATTRACAEELALLESQGEEFS